MTTKDMNLRDLREEKKVLAITSLAEFAERYGYYIIQSLLIFYLIDKFQSRFISIFSWYNSFNGLYLSYSWWFCC